MLYTYLYNYDQNMISKDENEQTRQPCYNNVAKHACLQDPVKGERQLGKWRGEKRDG